MSLRTPEQHLLLEQLARCYGIEQTQLRCLRDDPGYGVYGFTRHGQDFFVKAMAPTVRTFSTLQGQVDWLNFLAAHDAPVSRPEPSLKGVLVEQLHLNDTVAAVVCYARVPGERPDVRSAPAEFFQTWGQVLGKLHTLSTHYTPSQPHAQIYHWNEDAVNDRQIIPADQTLVLEKFDALQEYFQALPKAPHLYGVIHRDVQANNLCFDNGKLWVIDFDDCEYNWYLMDLAVSLYFTLWERPVAQSNAAFAAFVLENLLAGYARERDLGAEWIERLPICLKFVEMNNYVRVTEYNQVALHDNPEAVPPKHRALLSRYRDNIEQDVPYIESAYFPWADD